VGSEDLFFHGQQVRQGYLTPYIGNIYFNHRNGIILSYSNKFLPVSYCKNAINARVKEKVSEIFLGDMDFWDDSMYNGRRK
jgi:hypothetical protein